jgi:DNA-binding response OmpR family regulator/archaellum component FlaC
MWVNKEFILRLNETLRATARGRSEYDLAGFDFFKSKKYQDTIDLIRKFQTEHREIGSEINDILKENYRNDLSTNDDMDAPGYKLKLINRNLKNLTEDLQNASGALDSDEFDYLLPARNDHQSLRNSFNRSLRNVSNQINRLKTENDRKGKKIEDFERMIRDRECYLARIVEVVKDVAAGNDTVEVSWSDRDQELFAALQEVKTVVRKTIRFLGDLACGMPVMEALPFTPESQLGGALYEAAESVNCLVRKLDQSNQLLRRLEQEQHETGQFMEMVTYYIEGIAIGDYTQKVPFYESEPVLVAALEQVKKSFEEISTAALKAAEGNMNQQDYLPEHHGLVRSAFKQMLQSFRTRQSQLLELVKEKSGQVTEGLRFEKQFEELSDRYEKTIAEQQEQNRLIDRLQKKSDRLEEELKTLKQKHGTQSKQVKGLQDDKERLQESAKRSSLLVKNLLASLERDLTRLGSLAEPERKEAAASRVTPSQVLQQVGKQAVSIRETIAKAVSDLEGAKQPRSVSEIELQTFIQELHLELKDLEAEAGSRMVFEVQETAPRVFYSDEVRLKRILELLARHNLKNATSEYVTCRIYRAASEVGSGGSGPMVAFEIQAHNKVPLGGQQLMLEAFDGLYEIRRRDWDDVDLGLTLLRELAGVINGELHLHSVQGDNDTYLLLIPLNLGAVKEDFPTLVSRLPEKDEPVIFVLEDDTRFLNAIVNGFAQGKYKCVPVDSIEQAVEWAEQNLPQAVCLGMKWIGEQGLTCMQSIATLPAAARTPFIALTEKPKIPEDWVDYCIGFLEKTAGPADYQRMIERMHAFRRYPLPNLAILARPDDLNGRVNGFLKNFNLSSELIGDAESDADLSRTSHLLLVSDGEQPAVDSAIQLIESCRQDYPALPVIAGITNISGYLFRNRIEPMADAYLELNKVEDSLLYEIVRLLHLSCEQPVKERQQRISEYLNSRNELIKDKHALMITEDASATMALRKQLNLLGLVIRVNTHLKNVVSGLSTQARCDLVIINSVKLERDVARIVKEIRTSKEYKSLPILVMGDSGHLGDDAFWRDKGASFYLPGPYEFQTLLSAIRVSIGSLGLV